MIEAQALDDMRHRPFGEMRAEILGLEPQRPGAWPFHRAGDPQLMIGGAEQRLAAIGPVEQHAEARLAVRHLGRPPPPPAP